MSDPAQLSPAELVTRVRSAYGLTWAELGAAMNRSPRMMQKLSLIHISEPTRPY